MKSKFFALAAATPLALTAVVGTSAQTDASTTHATTPCW